MIAALGVFLGYPIQFFVMIKILWPPLKRSNNCTQKYPITSQVCLRFFMVMMTCKWVDIYNWKWNHYIDQYQ